MECEVLRVALAIEAASETSGIRQWCGVTIQDAGWPNWRTYIAKKSGISAAIQTLKHRGLAVSNGHWFHLSDLGKTAAKQLQRKA